MYKLNEKSKNILIGENAGLNFTNEINMLVLKSKNIKLEKKVS